MIAAIKVFKKAIKFQKTGERVSFCISSCLSSSPTGTAFKIVFHDLLEKN